MLHWRSGMEDPLGGGMQVVAGKGYRMMKLYPMPDPEAMRRRLAAIRAAVGPDLRGRVPVEEGDDDCDHREHEHECGEQAAGSPEVELREVDST